MAANRKAPQILQRARGLGDGELVSIKENSKTVQEEVLRRSAKAGYSTRLGEPTSREKISSGWSKLYAQNYVRIFGHD